jgi:hypothetical protein
MSPAVFFFVARLLRLLNRVSGNVVEIDIKANFHDDKTLGISTVSGL